MVENRKGGKKLLLKMSLGNYLILFDSGGPVFPGGFTL